MIINFDQYTQDLSSDEITAAEIISNRLKSNVGKKMVRTNKYISDTILKEYGIKITSARMRKIINWIRTKGIIPNLVATAKGYYVSTDKEEIDKYVYSLRQRARAILAVSDVMESYNNNQNLQKTA